MCVRERLFMYNLQYGVACSSSIDRTDMCYAMTRDAHKLEPVPDSEQPQWAAERTPTLGGIVLAASRLAKSKGDAERMKEFDSMIDRTRLEVPTAILEPHLAFER